MSCRSFLNLFILLILTACSVGVEDKNAGMSDSQKKALKAKNENTLVVDSVKIIAQDERREDNTAISAIQSKYYTLQVCFRDPNISGGLGNRPVTVDGEDGVLLPNGCLNFSHEIIIDHSSSNRCKVYEKEVYIGGRKVKTVKYSIDYYKNHASDLAQSKGCVSQNVSQKQFRKIQPIQLREVMLSYGTNLTDLRSDVRQIKHGAKIRSCMFVPMTGQKLGNVEFEMEVHNLETGEISKANPQGNQKVKTAFDGCFSTGYIATYDQYQYSHWMTLELNIKILSGTMKGTEVKRKVYVNPWEGRQVYGYGYEGDIPIERTDIRNKWARLFMDGVMYIQIGNDNNQMDLNDYLGLTISKTYQVVLNPYIDYGHRYSKDIPARKRIMRDGKFKLSLVLLAPKAGDMGMNKTNFKNFEYITGVEAEVEVLNGVINKILNIPFKVKDMPRLALKTMSIFKLEPIKDPEGLDTGLQSSVVTGFFKARIPWIKTNVLQDLGLNVSDRITDLWSSLEKKHGKEFDIKKIDKSCSKIKEIEMDQCLNGMRDIHDYEINGETMEYRKFVNKMFAKLSVQTNQSKNGFKMKISPKKIYLNHLTKNIKDLKVFSKSELEDELNVNISQNDFDQLFPYNETRHHITENMAEELCRYAFHRDGSMRKFLGYFWVKKPYNHCTKNPYKYFKIKSTRHVKRLNGIDKTQSYSDSFAMFVGNNEGVNKGENEQNSVSVSRYIGTDIGGKINVPFTNEFLGIGFKAGTSKNWTNSKSKNKGYTKTENVGNSKGVSVEYYVNKINADFERCFLVESQKFADPKKVMEAEMKRTGAYTSYYGFAGAGNIPNIKDIPDYDNMPEFQTDLGINMFICDDEITNEDYVESWYFVQSRVESGFMIDADNGRERVVLKSFRGNYNYWEMVDFLRNLNQNALISDNIGYTTPGQTLVEHWGHLVSGGIPKEESAQFLLDHVEGSFPGTIEGNGSVPNTSGHP